MAGDWIKFEVGTPEKPEVFAITAAMGWPDPDLTVGKLLKVWRWFDQQTIDGNAVSVTPALLDCIASVSGFANAMINVGWLVVSDMGLTLPNFERHNGKTAKQRCQTAKRVANHKNNANSNDEGNGVSVTNALPREEKRREDSKARGSRLPEDWKPSPEDIEYCKKNRPDLKVSEVCQNFYDYWIAKPGADGRKSDWSATWRSWVRKEKTGSFSAEPSLKIPRREQVL